MTAPGGWRDLDRAEILRLLAKVDDVLSQHRQSVVVYVVEGANISLTVDESRTTVDIDAVIRSGYDALLDAARTVAESEPGLPEDWINADFTGGDNPSGTAEDAAQVDASSHRDVTDATLVHRGTMRHFGAGRLS